jgi:hypothetical protein
LKVEYCLLALDRRRPDLKKFHNVHSIKASARPKRMIKSNSRTVLSMGRLLSRFAAGDFKCACRKASPFQKNPVGVNQA